MLDFRAQITAMVLNNAMGIRRSTHGEMRNVYSHGKVYEDTSEHACQWDNNIKIDLETVVCEVVDKIWHSPWRVLVDTVMNIRF